MRERPALRVQRPRRLEIPLNATCASEGCFLPSGLVTVYPHSTKPLNARTGSSARSWWVCKFRPQVDCVLNAGLGFGRRLYHWKRNQMVIRRVVIAACTERATCQCHCPAKTASLRNVHRDEECTHNACSTIFASSLHVRIISLRISEEMGGWNHEMVVGENKHKRVHARPCATSE